MQKNIINSMRQFDSFLIAFVLILIGLRDLARNELS
jgi:hypothetical protein